MQYLITDAKVKTPLRPFFMLQHMDIFRHVRWYWRKWNQMIGRLEDKHKKKVLRLKDIDFFNPTN